MTLAGGSSDGQPVELLTRREREILALLAQGHSAPEIATQLTVALSSVKSHIQHLYGKLGVNGKRQAVVRAVELGLLDAPVVGARPPAGLTPLLTGPPAGRPRAPASQHNLPLQLTQFIGHAQPLTEVKRLLRSTRLLTLTGPGGIGKTRLALRVAAELIAEVPDGAWLVELAPIVEPTQVPYALAQALGLRAKPVDALESAPVDQPDQDGLALIVEHLRDQYLLVILDNCEHLVQACAELAERLLRASPRLRILATSREALGVVGETSYPVPALSLPDTAQHPPLATLLQSEAVQLFVQRAGAVRSDFALTDENAVAVARICRQLDGIPLALELAAALVRVLSVEQIAERLNKRFALLASGSRTAPPRQQTLRGTIDWSYDLLTEAERRLLRQLSVFAGGWSLAAAEHVADGPATLDLLVQLVAKSLVHSNQPPGQETRFGMLETIREYAEEKLAEAGETTSARRRHLAYYLALAEDVEPQLRGHRQVHWLKCLDQENDNLRRALAWALETEDTESALRLAGALPYFWRIRDYRTEGGRWVEAALRLHVVQAAPAHGHWLARALFCAGWMGLRTPESDSQSQLEQALELFTDLGDKVGMARTLAFLADQRQAAQEYLGAVRYYEQALELALAVKSDWDAAYSLHYMGHAIAEMGNLDKARELYQRSAEKFMAVGDAWQMAGPLLDLSRDSWADGDSVRARATLEKNLVVAEALGSHDNMFGALNSLNLMALTLGDYAQAQATALAIQNLPGLSRYRGSGLVRLGLIDYLQGHLAEAQAHFEAGRKIFQALNDQAGLGWIPPWLGCIAYRTGDLDRAQALIEQGLTIADPNGYWPEQAFALLARGDVARAKGALTTATEYYTRSLRLVLKNRQQPDVAERLEGFAKLAVAAGRPLRAARLFGAAQALRDRIGTPIPAVERADYDGAVAQARAQLGTTTFDAAWNEGLGMDWKQAAAYALEIQPNL